MSVVNMLDAKTNLSKLVQAVEDGEESEIVIARNGRPVARLVPIEGKARKFRIGLAKGKFRSPKPDPKIDQEVARLFRGG